VVAGFATELILKADDLIRQQLGRAARPLLGGGGLKLVTTSSTYEIMQALIDRGVIGDFRCPRSDSYAAAFSPLFRWPSVMTCSWLHRETIGFQVPAELTVSQSRCLLRRAGRARLMSRSIDDWSAKRCCSRRNCFVVVVASGDHDGRVSNRSILTTTLGKSRRRDGRP
jgi:hypothetical protein